jgi:superfamily I DNA/RNA helicase
MNEAQPEGRAQDVRRELDEAIAKVLASRSARKLVVAGPGAGKTTLFRKLLEACPGHRDTRLVLTFIVNLKSDLQRSLGDLASIYTLHGYCQHLLHSHAALRAGLTENFVCYPGLATIIKSDWTHQFGSQPLAFVNLMRNLAMDPAIEYYINRTNYYDAVDFDDSVYRTYLAIAAHPETIQGLDLVLIDEYQDFNRMEAALIEVLAQNNPIVVAGDDDQALYSQLRGASWDHIRALYVDEQYEKFTLPFCMRCPEVIVDAVNDVIAQAGRVNRLRGRIEKPFRHFEPAKGEASRQYPNISLITTSVQRQKPNYFGKFIFDAIGKIPRVETAESREKHEPTALIIASNPYRRQIESYLSEFGQKYEGSSSEPTEIKREDGLAFLNKNPRSNLGWRIIIHFEDAETGGTWLRDAAAQRLSLIDVLPQDFATRVLEEAGLWTPAAVEPVAAEDDHGPVVKVTSFEGSKGLSAQHVFIVGMHEEELPRDSNDIKDIEVCKFLVGLTRTKKKCNLLITRRFGDQVKHPSKFLSWIEGRRYEKIYVDAKYWKRRGS